MPQIPSFAMAPPPAPPGRASSSRSATYNPLTAGALALATPSPTVNKGKKRLRDDLLRSSNADSPTRTIARNAVLLESDDAHGRKHREGGEGRAATSRRRDTETPTGSDINAQIIKIPFDRNEMGSESPSRSSDRSSVINANQRKIFVTDSASEMSTPLRRARRPMHDSRLSISRWGVAGPSTERKERITDATPRRMMALSAMITPWANRPDPRRPDPTDSEAESGMKSKDGVSIMDTAKRISAGVLRSNRIMPRDEAEGAHKNRKLGEISAMLPEPTSVKKEAKVEEEGRRVGLQSVVEGVKREGIEAFKVEKERSEMEEKEEEQEMAWGVTPRKKKVKWNGRGEPPLNHRLVNLISSQTAAVNLFQTSVQHTIMHGQSSSYRDKPQTSAISSTSISTAVLEYVRAAPIRLILVRPLPSRQHTGHLWVARVKRWPTPPVRLSTMVHRNDGQGEEDEPDEIIVNFVVRKDYGPRGQEASIGVDIRLAKARWEDTRLVQEGHSEATVPPTVGADRSTGGKWEVGVWNEWGLLKIPPVSDWKDVGGGTGEGLDSGNTLNEKLGRSNRVLFASRYVIAEVKSN